VSDTPETDSMVAEFSCPDDAMIPPDFCRKLERERDMLRRQVEVLIELISENPCLANCQAAAGCCRETTDLCAAELRHWSLEQAEEGGGGE
jgi:hypothetical protein